MDYQELLFASAVRDRAAQLRKTKTFDFQDAQTLSGEPAAAELAAWKKENPDTKFILEALNEITDIATFIRKHRSAQPVVDPASGSLSKP